jgi:heme iron utilization protein
VSGPGGLGHTTATAWQKFIYSGKTMPPPETASGFTDKARVLVQARTFGVLSTLLSSSPDQPFGSMVNYAADDAGAPLFLLSSLAVHTTNLKVHAKASLSVYEEGAETNLLESARMTLVGSVVAVPDLEEERVRAVYLKRHPEATEYVDFGDFSFYRLEVDSVYYIGGFGEMGWISGAEFRGPAIHRHG